MAKSMKLGGGGRFAKLEGELAQKPGIANPAGLAAKIGRENLGKAKFQGLAEKGRERAEPKAQSKGPGLSAALKS